MLGFLGKSNILICSLDAYDYFELFSLDVDAAFSATTSEGEDMAFALPLRTNQEIPLPSYGLQHFEPVYRTDKKNGCVDLVGVLGRRSKSMADTYHFVTEISLR